MKKSAGGYGYNGTYMIIIRQQGHQWGVVGGGGGQRGAQHWAQSTGKGALSSFKAIVSRDFGALFYFVGCGYEVCSIAGSGFFNFNDVFIFKYF
jgi:hypothetical protein